MKTNWQIKKLGEVCDVYQPKTISAKQMVANGEYVVFGANGVIGRYDKYNNEDSQLLITCRGATCGSVNISTPKSWITGNAMVVRPKNEFLLLKYLEYIFRGGIDVSKVITGTAQPQITRANLEPIEISFPLPVEQDRIVKKLDEVFEKIAKAKENAEKNLRNSKELFESYLQSVFANPGKGWVEKSLEQLGQITSSKRIYKKEYVKEGVPFYRIKEVKELAHDKNIAIELFISNKRYKEIKEVFGVPAEGDILMTAVGTIGEIYVVGKDGDFYFKDGNVLWFKDFNSVDPYFLKFVLMSFVENIKKLSKGSAYSALTIEKIEKHKIFIPKSLSEQKAIVRKLDILSEDTKKLENNYKHKLSDLDEFKKSILNKAFTQAL